jgi:hypothetical protein
MTIEMISLLISIGEIIGYIILMAYLWKKTDWKQKRKFEKFRCSIDWEKLSKAPLP